MSNTSTSVKVAVRVRPLTAKEQLANCTDCTHIPSPSTVIIGDKTFHFDHVFNTFTVQSSVYESVVAPLIEKFLDGFNATILAYGQVSLNFVLLCLGLDLRYD